MSFDSDNVVRIDTIVSNINKIDISIISEIEAELDYCDVISLVFLLYDDSRVASEHIQLLETLSKSDEHVNLDKIYRWAVISRTNPYWRYEFLEALSICQLNNVIRKLGFSLNDVKSHYLPDNVNAALYIHPMKKLLYKQICEKFLFSQVNKLKHLLEIQNITVHNCETCEAILLILINENFISIGKTKSQKNPQPERCNIKKLRNILKDMDIQEHCNDLTRVEALINESSDNLYDPSDFSSESTTNYQDEYAKVTELCQELLQTPNFTSNLKLKTDIAHNPDEVYTIVDPDNVGLCYIINQVNFKMTKKSNLSKPLEKRKGSEKDKALLIKIFENKFNFKVKCDDDLNHDEILPRIRFHIKNSMEFKHSMFALFILSHGKEGVVFGADSVPIAISKIEQTVHNAVLCRPKMIVIQACQGETPVLTRIWPTGDQKETYKPTFVTDGPNDNIDIQPEKTDLLTSYATIEGHSAFRDENAGSIFIQVLCFNLEMFGHKEQATDIFIRVNRHVTKIELPSNKEKPVRQVPKFEVSLRKKLYLMPLSKMAEINGKNINIFKV